MRADGREVLARLALPLPFLVAGDLMRAIGEAAERLGYTDVVILLADDEHLGAIAGTPPAAVTVPAAPSRPETAGGRGTVTG